VPDLELDGSAMIADVAVPTAGFRDEYYGLTSAVVEHDCLEGIFAPLITAGLVDIGRCAWGERAARFAKRRWRAPVVDVAIARANPAAAAWITRTRVPKIVVATQTRVMEAAVDEAGTWVPSVPLIVVPAPPRHLWRVAAAICSPPVTAWVAHRAAGTALAQRALKVSARLVGQIPLPRDDDAWQAGADALCAGDLRRFGEAMVRAYNTESDVLRWWQHRASF
jgi:hypothetical protein